MSYKSIAIPIIIIVLLCVYVFYFNKNESFTIDGPAYINIGCFNDDKTRVIPHYAGRVNSVEEAILVARKHQAPIFGIQEFGSLYLGYDLEKAISLGTPDFNNLSDNLTRNMELGVCGDMGGEWINQVYVAQTNYNYNNLGCYASNTNIKELTPMFIDVVISETQAMNLANKYAAPLFSIQNGNLFVGYDLNKLNLNNVEKRESIDKLACNLYVKTD
jgi:hypothetical protein